MNNKLAQLNNFAATRGVCIKRIGSTALFGFYEIVTGIRVGSKEHLVDELYSKLVNDDLIIRSLV